MSEQPKQDKPKTISWPEALGHETRISAAQDKEIAEGVAAEARATWPDDFDFDIDDYSHFNAEQFRALIEYVGWQVTDAEREVERLNHRRIELEAMASELELFQPGDYKKARGILAGLDDEPAEVSIRRLRGYKDEVSDDE